MLAEAQPPPSASCFPADALGATPAFWRLMNSVSNLFPKQRFSRRQRQRAVTAALTFRDYSDIKSCAWKVGGGVWRAGGRGGPKHRCKCPLSPLSAKVIMAKQRRLKLWWRGEEDLQEVVEMEPPLRLKTRQLSVHADRQPPPPPQMLLKPKRLLSGSLEGLSQEIAGCVGQPGAEESEPPTALPLICLQTRVCFPSHNVFFQWLRRSENGPCAGPGRTKPALMGGIIAQLWLPSTPFKIPLKSRLRPTNPLFARAAAARAPPGLLAICGSCGQRLRWPRAAFANL